MAKGKRPFQKKKVGAAIRTSERPSEEMPASAKKPMKKKVRKAMGMGLAATAPGPGY